MKDRIRLSAFALSVAALAATCDKVPLLAPSGSLITLSANAVTVPTNGTVGLTAFVTESSGTAVQNGTTVSFSTTLGTVTPVQTQTTNGLAVAMFSAGSASGVATVRAISGGATGGSGSGGATATTTAANTVLITIGAAAVKTVTVSANPSSVSPNGGSVTLTASVVDTTGGSLTGIPVNFSADHGTVNPAVATTDVSGLATTTLTTAVETKVTASAGTATGTATVTLRASPGVTLQCAAGNLSCTAVPASDSTNTATVTFTVTKPTTSSPLRDVTLDFGDGTRQGLGTLPAASATVPHTYSGSSGSTATYVAVVTATDLENERSTASTIVNVTPRAPLTLDLKAEQATAVAAGQTVTFTATLAGGTAQSFTWDFGDGSPSATTTSNKTAHVYTPAGGKVISASVTATTTDGRTASARTEFIVP